MQLAGYRVVFTHINNTNQELPLQTVQVVLNPGVTHLTVLRHRDESSTVCTIQRAVSEGSTAFETIVEGKAILHEGDNYCKETGRKLSLALAFKHSGLTKEQKAEIWEAYRVSSPIPRWGN